MPGIEQARIALEVNGQARQNSVISKMIWNIAETIEQLSIGWILQPGDLIYSGTPEGVGAVQAGDVLVGSVDGLSDLRMIITAPAAT